MNLGQIVGNKENSIIKIGADATIGEAVALLSEHQIGALVVTSDENTLNGILSERDIVRSLANSSKPTMSLLVSELMTTDVHTCTLSASVSELMTLMTANRIRHVPIITDGKLSGIVSIGDIVKARLNELEAEHHEMEAYIKG